MTYLHFPRFHFAGRFYSDPATVNNEEDAYKAQTEPFDRSEFWRPHFLGPWNWNPDGHHAFRFEGVRITSALQADGAAVAPTDPILQCRFETGTRGRLVDLDPDQQLASMIFGLQLTLAGDSANHIAVEGDMAPVPFTDIWRRALSGGGDEGASAIYQSVIAVRSWGETSISTFLQELQAAVPDNVLSIKFNADGYSMRRPADGTANPRFRRGRVVGTVGPAASREPKHFVVGRQFGDEVHPPGSAHPQFTPTSGVNYFPGLVDASEEMIQFDLGNALPVQQGGGPVAVADIGVLSAGCRSEDGSVTEIDTIAYGGSDWYEATAGVVRVPRERTLTQTEKQMIRTSPLVLVAQREGQRRIVSEEAEAYVRADSFVARLNPGDTFVVRFHASRLGRPATNARIHLSLWQPDVPEFPVHGLTFPSSVGCDENGIAVATMRANDPGNPRFHYTFGGERVNVDGQVYRVTYQLDDLPQPNPSNFLSILVWNTFVADEPPTWHGSMRHVFKQYGDLYPVMTNSVGLDLADYEAVVAQREAILDAIQLPIEDPRYMPVTRDLSRSRRDAMVRWLTELGPDGKPLLGEERAPIPGRAARELPPGAPPQRSPYSEFGSKTVAGMRTPTPPPPSTEPRA